MTESMSDRSDVQDGGFGDSVYFVHRCRTGVRDRHRGVLIHQIREPPSLCTVAQDHQRMETTIIKDFYDSFAKEQVKTGINERHHLILELALTNGLKDGMRVLELGCGIGTLTGERAQRSEEHTSELQSH